jgi:hypothetical protein
MTEAAQAAAVADEIGAQADWRATRAKLLARRGEFAAARQLMAEAEALLSSASPAAGTRHRPGGQGRGEPAHRGTRPGCGQPVRRAADLRRSPGNPSG